MRDILEDLFKAAPLDPSEAARRSLRGPSRQRFYRHATTGDDLVVALDGKPVRTPARHPLQAPNRALADKLAQEWEAQAEQIDPAAMPLTRLANAIIDGVAAAPRQVAREIEQYLGSDLVFYRAEHPAALVARQNELWNPLIDFARDALGARFVLAQGVVHVAQPAEAVAAAARAIPAELNSPHALWRLGALASVTTLTGSALIGLALMRGEISADAAWAAAHVEEDWNMAAWGRDEDALARRASRRAEFDAAAAVLALLR